MSTARVTIVDPVPLSAERQAQAWIESIDPEQEAQAAVDVLNRILHFQRVTSADPHIHEVSASQALVVRVGWGAGEQVADGRWLHARELARPPGGGGRRRSAAAVGARPGGPPSATSCDSRNSSAGAAPRCSARSSRCERGSISTGAAHATRRSSSSARSQAPSPS